MSCWVLLRGLSREARHWGDFPLRLAAAFPGDTILTPDLPGCGRRWRERSPNRIAGIVASVRDELAAQALAPPYSLIALSLGGMVAVEWACRRPDELARAVLINTSLRPFCPFHERLRPRSYLPLCRLAVGAPDALARESAILEMTSATAPASLATEWAGWLREAPVTRANVFRQLVAAVAYRAPRQSPPVPLLILSGAGDRLVDPACSQRIAAAWGVVHRQHPTGGHDLPLDAGDWIVEMLRGRPRSPA